MNSNITVETRIKGIIYVPVSLSETMILTKAEYGSLTEKNNDTLYICTERLFNGDNVVSEIYHLNTPIYSRSDAEFSLYVRKFLSYALKDSGYYITSDGKIYCVLE